jgi:hypothetical protein
LSDQVKLIQYAHTLPRVLRQLGRARVLELAVPPNGPPIAACLSVAGVAEAKNKHVLARQAVTRAALVVKLRAAVKAQTKAFKEELAAAMSRASLN